MISLFIVLLAAVAGLIGWAWISIVAGRENLFWGLVCFFISPVCLAYPFASDRTRDLMFPWALFTFGFAISFILPALGMPF